MKIGILTQPLHYNYGGILQAYALQKSLKSMGHEVWIINRVTGKQHKIRKFFSLGKKILLKYFLFRNNIPSPFARVEKITDEEKTILCKYTSVFVKSYITPMTEKIDNTKKLKMVASQNFNAFIVGSDQVWRLDYSPGITNYFLDFVKNKKNIIKIAYAASFGLDYWHYKKSLTKKCKKLINNFDAVSVREESAVKLCKEYFNINAQQLVDPTLLLQKEDYEKLVSNENVPQSDGDLLLYILDPNVEKSKIINDVEITLGLEAFSVMPSKKFHIQKRSEINDCIYPPVTKWLKGFSDAKFVITDSFHGCIFSILYNIPFIAFGNSKRGITRFESILKMFGLMDRLILNLDEVKRDLIIEPIDWVTVNKKLENEREKSFKFLKESLGIVTR